MSRDSVRVRARSGVWEELGVDRWRGIVPEAIRADVDTAGPRTLNFTLKRTPGVPWGDLEQLAEIEYRRDDALVWGGNVQDAPTDAASSSAAVSCIGGRAFADLAPVEKLYVHSRMSDWKDVRSCPTNPQTGTRPTLAGANGFGQRGVVNVSDGLASIGWGGNAGAVPLNDTVGIYIDLGDEVRASNVYIAWESFNPTALGAAALIYLRGADAPPFTGGNYAGNADAIAGAQLQTNGTNTGTLYGFGSRTVRYVVLMLYMSSSVTPTVDCMLRVTDLRVMTSSSYVGAAGAFLLKADAVAKELATSGAIQGIHADELGDIAPATFGIPHLTSDGLVPPSTILDKAYGFEDQTWGIDAAHRLFTKARPSSPRLRVVNDSAFKDAGGYAARDAYNACIVIGKDAGGNPIRVRRHAAQGLSSFVWRPSSALIAGGNHNFDAGPSTTGWVTNAGIVTDAAFFDSSPVSMKAANAPAQALGLLTGFTPGRYYRIKWRMRVSAGGRAGGAVCTVTRQDFASNSFVYLPSSSYGPGGKAIPVANDTWEDCWVDFVAPQSGLMVRFETQTGGIGATAWVDSFEVYEAETGTLDRNGLVRTALLESNAALTDAGAAQLADIWLRTHVVTPMKGSVTVGLGDVVDYTSGGPVPPAALLRMVGEYAHFGNLRDPDTGALGRDGLIVSATYDADSDTAELTIDNERGSFEKVLSRVGALQTFAGI